MPYNPNIHHRRNIRLKGYDYSQAGLYFITICVQDRACLFGEIANSEMMLNDAGRMVENEWLKIPQRFPNVHLHEYVVMPNHFHAIMEIVGATLVVAPNAPNANAVAPNANVVAPNAPNANAVAPSAPNANVVAPNATNANAVAPNANDENDVVAPNANVVAPNAPNANAVAPNAPNANVVAPNAPNADDENDAIAPDELVDDEEGQTQGFAPTGKPKTVGDMVGAFQSIVTVEYIRGVKQQGWRPFNGKLWQRNYWEHIIRDEQSYQRISTYIINNPKNWNSDKFY